MKRLKATLLALFLSPALALAQNQNEGLGLDLTAEDPKPQEENPNPPEEPLPPPVAEPAPAEEPLTEAARDITAEDRVKSVQRKVYLKKGRFELSPMVSVSVNDAYYWKLGGSLRAAYFLADTLSIAARGSVMQVVPSDEVRTAKRTFQSRIYYSVPQWSTMGDVEWSPLYGKVAFLNSILHFDGYLLGGVGVMKTETSSKRGLKPAVDLGVGMRFVTKDFFAVNVALINTSYVDQPLGTTKGATQNIMTLNAGISLFLPLKSTGREAE
ncbi:outer membrane beta-barrel domain-containing protein [Myxococcaceae bacterium GXIMD 01537]